MTAAERRLDASAVALQKQLQARMRGAAPNRSIAREHEIAAQAVCDESSVERASEITTAARQRVRDEGVSA